MSDTFDQSYLDYQVNRSALRRFVRQLYLKRAASLAAGRCIDFGCGAGELLARLGKGSVGLEYNRAAVEYCRHKGLDVSHYDGFADDWSLQPLAGRRFDTLVISHVLEHLDAPMMILCKLLDAAAALGVRQALVIVPQEAGYKVDATHRTFVDLGMLAGAIDSFPEWTIKHHGVFPFDVPFAGRVFAYNELQVVLGHTSTASV